jgi:hypothetical protein
MQPAKATEALHPLPQTTATPQDSAELADLPKCADSIADIDIVYQGEGDGFRFYNLRVRYWIKRPAELQEGPQNLWQFRNDQNIQQPMIDLSAPQDHWILFMRHAGKGNFFNGVCGAYGIKHGIIVAEGVYLFGSGSNYPHSYLGWSATRFLATVRSTVQPAALLPDNGHSSQDMPAIALILALIAGAGGVLLRYKVSSE